MTPERWRSVRSLFHQVIDLQPEERAARLRACSPDLAADAERLLGQLERAGPGFLASPPSAVQALRSSEPLFLPGDLAAGRFRIRRRIGCGGMGEVYEAVDTVLDVRLAIKTLASELSGEPGFEARFKREVYLARRITHPNVCRIYDLAAHAANGRETALLTMEYIEGETLAEMLRRTGRIGGQDARPFIRQLLDGLMAAHSAGVVHRDLKPANIMIERGTGRLVVMDFGLARPCEPAAPVLSRAGEIWGTVEYMAPEQFRGEADQRSDIYAVGLILYELLTGKPPFGREPDSSSRPPPRPQPQAPGSLFAGLPSGWDRAILRCLALDPKDRFPSASHLAAALHSQTLLAAGAELLHTRLTRRAALLGAGICAAAGAGVWLWGRRSDPFSSAPGAAVFLAPVGNATSEPELSTLGELLAAELSQSPHFRLIDPQSVPQVLERMVRDPNSPLEPAVAREAALRLGASVIVFAAVTRVGSEYAFVFVLERLAFGSAAPAASERRTFTAPNRDELRQRIHDASRWMRSMLGESLQDRAELDLRPEEATTSSWPALVDFTRGQRETAAGRRAEALAAFDEAVRADPEFALAHMRRGDILVSLARSAEGFQAWAVAMQTAASRRLSKREQFRIRGMYFNDTWDFARAIQTYEGYQTYFPYDREPLQYRARPLLLCGRGEESVAVLRRAWRLDPGFRTAPVSIALHAAILGDFAEADRNLALAKAAEPRWSARVGAIAAFIRGDYGRVDELLLAAERDGDELWRSALITLRAHLWAEFGRWQPAVDLLAAAIPRDRAAGFTSEWRRKVLSYAALLFRLSDRKAAERQMRLVAEDDCGVWLQAMAVAVYARYGRLAAARALSRRFVPVLDAPLFRIARATMAGEIALAEGAHREARTAFENAAREAPAAWPREALARALAASGDRFGALECCRRTVAAKGIIWHSSELQLPGFWGDGLLQAIRIARSAGAGEISSWIGAYRGLRPAESAP